ncbi:hypothetical protein [Pseudoduganella lutea]|uniref:Uncharacterized protein n=1 Tax=Pseudoduganella lutea TaxID=321985 RepID=A0A4P6L0K3_9BURK|nr:hypothetical protein [Pseudoduganella lutea]QBE64807.1 hypothetical protein EWM63_18935 [Pseudoduganella lutea]
MITAECRSATSRNAAGRFATELLISRCRTGAEPVVMPQNRWFAATTQGFHDWLGAGGFQSEIEAVRRQNT